ncbi:hypothetical protein AVL62_11185 [Serinicoccus chungangensis]|uniref:Uncharacterized protein n=1 Tax=Serinicoccus chungangensis TaxID=767452 RepID=A0A0W8IEY7_9MICO|nr:hypothetical protein [Serinicoccus chungangensis]KUG58456.1 hypothetical protein AVL62_11185 [Serinicoccus chungangensis]
MSLSPHGSSAVATGSLRKGVPVMLLGGILAWVAGQSWSVQRGSGEVFQVLMAYGNLAVMAVAAQLIAGPRGRGWMMATAGAVGMTVPWFFGLAVAQQGQGVLVPTLVVAVTSWAMTYAVATLTRRTLGNRHT